MRKAHQVLAGILAVEVVVQAMLIAYTLAAAFHAIKDDHRDLTNRILSADSPKFPGLGIFGVHAMNGSLVAVVALLLLVVSFLVKDVPGAVQRASVLFFMVVLQFVLGIGSESVPALAPLHALNAFGIFAMAVMAARKASESAAVPA